MACQSVTPTLPAVPLLPPAASPRAASSRGRELLLACSFTRQGTAGYGRSVAGKQASSQVPSHQSLTIVLVHSYVLYLCQRSFAFLHPSDHPPDMLHKHNHSLATPCQCLFARRKPMSTTSLTDAAAARLPRMRRARDHRLTNLNAP